MVPGSRNGRGIDRSRTRSGLATSVRNERIDQGGFADARFAAYKHHLTSSTQRLFQPAVEKLHLIPALDKMGDNWPDRGKVESEPRPGLAGLDLSHSGDKPVSSAWNGFDVFLPGGRFAEDLAQGRDIVGEVALFHNSVRPNALDQLIFIDKKAVRFHEHTKGLEDLCAQSDRLSFPSQPAFSRVEPERPELIDDVCFRRHPHPHVSSLRKSPEGVQTRYRNRTATLPNNRDVAVVTPKILGLAAPPKPYL